MSFGALAFLNPWLLAALATLPIIYWLLRTVPPSPHQVTFPPTRILVGLENQEKTPAASPWWLTLIRLLAAALLIFALAEPVLNPSREAALDGTGPVAIVIDNGWASASRWDERTRMVDRDHRRGRGQEPARRHRADGEHGQGFHRAHRGAGRSPLHRRRAQSAAIRARPARCRERPRSCTGRRARAPASFG